MSSATLGSVCIFGFAALAMHMRDGLSHPASITGLVVMACPVIALFLHDVYEERQKEIRAQQSQKRVEELKEQKRKQNQENKARQQAEEQARIAREQRLRQEREQRKRDEEARQRYEREQRERDEHSKQQRNAEDRQRANKTTTETDYARILGLSGKCTPSDVKKRYRELVAQYHPDKVNHLGPKLRDVAENEIKLINEAYAYFKNQFGL